MVLSSTFKELRLCLRLAVPLAAAQLTHVATSFVDTVMMGQLGSDVLAGGALGAATFSFMSVVFGGVISAVSPLVAEAFGREQPDQMRRIFWQGIGLAIGLSPISMLVLGQATHWLPLLGQNPAILTITLAYLQVILWGSLPALLFVVLRSFITALGHTRIVMLAVLLGTAVNIIGNYGLALGHWGLPALGVKGIALASVLSFGIKVLCMGGYLIWRPEFRQCRLFSQWPQFSSPVFSELLRVGLPIGGLAAMEGGMFTVVTILMGQFGVVVLAAHQIALQTISLTFMVPMGISMAATIRVGQLLGQKQLRTARKAGFVAIALGGAFMTLMALLLWGAPGAIVSLYLNVNDPDNQIVIQAAQGLLGVAAVFQLVDGIQVAALGALRGLRDTRIPFLIGFLAYWCLGLPGGYALARRLGWGGNGLWWGLALGLLFSAITLSWRFNQLLEPAGAFEQKVRYPQQSRGLDE